MTGCGTWIVATGRAYFSPRLHEILGLAEGALGNSIAAFLAQFDAGTRRRRGAISACASRCSAASSAWKAARHPAGEEPRWFVARGMIVYDGRAAGARRRLAARHHRREAGRGQAAHAVRRCAGAALHDRPAGPAGLRQPRASWPSSGVTLEDMSNGGWDWKQDVHPDDLARTTQLYREALARQENVTVRASRAAP